MKNIRSSVVQALTRNIQIIILCMTCSFISKNLVAKNLDSLQKQVYTIEDAKAKQKILTELCEHARMIHFDSLRKYVQLLNDQALHSNDTRDLVLGNYYKCIYFYRVGKLDSFLQNYLHFEKQSRQVKDYKIKYKCAYANYLVKKNKHQDAYKKFYEVLREAEQVKDSTSMIIARIGIGWNHMELNQFDTAVTWFKSALNLSNNPVNEIYYPSTYINLASCYGAMGQFDSSRSYCNKGIEISERNNDLLALANGYFIKGSLANVIDDFKTAENSFLKGYEIHKRSGDPFYLVSDMASISIHYSNTKQFEKGIQMANEAIEYARKNNLDAKLLLAYEALYVNYKASKQYEQQAKVLEKMLTLKDSNYANTSSIAIAEMNAQYETEKKERIIEKQKFELSKKNYLLVGGLLFILISSLLGYTAFRNYKFKQHQKLQVELIKQQDMAAKSVIEAEENERQRIAADLHDGLGQMLTAIKLNLDGLEHRIKIDHPEDKIIYDKVKLMVDDSCKEVRIVSHSIMPNALIKTGLGNAIKDFVEKVYSNKLRIQLHTEGINASLPSNIEIVVYRIIQESVNNVIKHAEASQLDISLIKDTEGLNVTIEDNGKGFDLEMLDQASGIGMKNIKTRIEFLKGSLDIDTHPGNGTLIAFHIPIAS